MKKRSSQSGHRYKVLFDHPYVKMKEGGYITPRCLQELSDYWDEIEPVFGRPGWYYDRVTGKSWIENFGRAWAYRETLGGRDDARQFKWQLAQATYEERPLSKKEFQAVCALTWRGDVLSKSKSTDLIFRHETFSRRNEPKLRAFKFKKNLQKRLDDLKASKSNQL